MAFVTSQSSSSSNLTPTTWDVFLSFRGTDTRYKFTSHLYAALDRHGVGTFKDDPDLRCGEVISDALLEAIRESRTYIVVFSENYASSPWCLDELVEIYNCHKTMARLVIPVFFNIDPSVVRHQTGSFKEDFEKHEVRFSGEMEKVNKWRLTLKQVANFSGKHVTQNRFEADIIIEIVDEILLQVDPKTLDVAKYPVGLDHVVKDITTLFSSGTQGVIRFGIYGMGGVGKTTLAKALYNQLLLGGSFKDSCFLANCREVSGTAKGLVSLQQQLINDVLKSKKIVDVDNVDRGIKLIGARICSTKVLVVIDDLDHQKQFEYLVGPFASGSIVIITTRDEELLDKIDVQPIYRYRVNVLDYDKSMTLFTRHAFGNAEPNSTSMVLTEEILCHAGGLPLALEVFGSYLYKRPEAGWKSFIEKLQRIPDNTIQKRLIISLDGLESDDPMLKKLFLDIACFFIGWEKTQATRLLETYYPDADFNIGILKKRCLLTIDDSNELRMHDLLWDIGRELSRNNSPNEPGKHSRLWAVKDVHDVLKKNKGTEEIECILPCNIEYENPLKGVSFSVDTFKRMSNLRFLYLEDVNIIGSFEQTFEDLRLLIWEGCPLTSFPSDLYPQKLGCLALRNSKMRTMRGLNMVFENLKDLDMSQSLDLTSTPDFTKLPCLETLNLGGCRSLEKVHISIGNLVKLVYLMLSGCVKLKSLPDTLCNLSALKVLAIDNCGSLEALPVKLGYLTSLKTLKAGRLAVSKLPDSIGCLSKLVKMVLSGNKNLSTLPDTICNLRALKVLDIHRCSSLRALPIDLGKMESLKKLLMGGLAVSEISNSIGNLSELVMLSLLGNGNLRTLPDTIWSLRSLEILDISECEKLEILPDKFWNLPRLKELYADGTPLKNVPNVESSQIALSSNLRKLYLKGNALTALPYGIGQFLNLRFLTIEDSVNLLSIEELPPKLTTIEAKGCTSLERLPNLSSLKDLKELDLTKCSSLMEIQGLTELTSLKQLYLGGCSSSLMQCTFTEHFFQVCSGYGHHIHIYPPEFPDWIGQSSEEEDSTVLFDLEPDVRDNFLGLILCFKQKSCDDNDDRYWSSQYFVKNTTSNLTWENRFISPNCAPCMVLIPRSILPLKNGDDRIQVKADAEICGTHLLYKHETTSI